MDINDIKIDDEVIVGCLKGRVVGITYITKIVAVEITQSYHVPDYGKIMNFFASEVKKSGDVDA